MEALSKSVVPTAVLTLFGDGSECWKPDRLGEEEIKRQKSPKWEKKEKEEFKCIYG